MLINIPSENLLKSALYERNRALENWLDIRLKAKTQSSGDTR